TDGRVVLATEVDRAPPNTLDDSEEVAAFLLDDDLTEQCAEQLDFAREGVAGARCADAPRFGAHGWVVSAGRCGLHVPVSPSRLRSPPVACLLPPPLTPALGLRWPLALCPPLLGRLLLPPPARELVIIL